MGTGELKMALDKFINNVRTKVAEKYNLKTDAEIDAFFLGMEESAKDNQEILEKRDKMLRDTVAELCEAKRLLKAAVDTNYSLHKSCHNCSHFTSDCNCDIGKYLYGTGEKECEWEWKHMSEIINFLHD
jgi:hypothetical protein